MSAARSTRSRRLVLRRPGAQSPAEIGEAEGLLPRRSAGCSPVAEAYPELKANESFLDLQAQLSETEDKIAISRQVYNDTVLTYNNAIQVLPAVLIAGPLGFEKREFLEIADVDDREPPVVSFQAPAADGPSDSEPSDSAPSDSPAA